MSTIPSRSRGVEGALMAGAIALMTALFVLFEGSFVWMAAVIAFGALALTSRGELGRRAQRWRLAAAGAMALVAVLIWMS